MAQTTGGSAVSKTSYNTVTIVGLAVAVVLIVISIYNIYILNKGGNPKFPKQPSGATDLSSSEAKLGRNLSIVALILGIVLAAFIAYEWFRPSLMKTLGDLELETGRAALLESSGVTKVAAGGQVTGSFEQL